MDLAASSEGCTGWRAGFDAAVDHPTNAAADREKVLTAAALALDAATAAHRAGGTTHDGLRMSLLSVLAQLLDRHERAVLCGQDGYGVTSVLVRDASARADRAAQQFRAHHAPPRAFLAELDCSAVELASVAVGMAVNLDTSLIDARLENPDRRVR